MKEKNKARSKIYCFFSFFLILGLYILLAFKEPFSTRTLIPNLEPYPDSLYYSVPAWNFIHGKGFNMSYLSYFVKQIFPPLYSLLLIPIFAIFRDVRSFYFTNLLLMIGSIFFLVLIIKKLFGNRVFDFFIIIFLLFLFISNFYIYTLPSYLLAENATVFLVAFCFYLLSTRVTKIKSVVSGGVGILFWLIKFSNFPLGLSFYFLYLLKTLTKENKKYFIYFFPSMAVFGCLFIVNVLTSQVFIGHKNLQANTSFSIKYFQNNLKFYLENLLGQKGQFLWFNEKMLSPIATLLAVAGIVAGFFSKKARVLLIYVLTFIITLVIFMCFFYNQDTRFIIALYPLIIILIAIFFNFVVGKVQLKLFLSFLIIISICLFLVKGFNQRTEEMMITTFKKQIGLNFRYKEDPWYYLAVNSFNRFFAKNTGTNVYLGTFLPPFFVHFYTNNHYIYLPLALDQDFFPGKGGLAEKTGIDSVYEKYRQLLINGKKVYVSNIFSNNLSRWREDFYLLLRQFNYRLVKKGCLDTCNLYEITLKNY